MAGERVMVCSWMLQEGSVHERYLREHGLAVEFHHPPGSKRTEEEMIGLLPGVATIASAEPYTRRVLAAADALVIIARVGVGYDSIDVAACAVQQPRPPSPTAAGHLAKMNGHFVRT